MKIAILILIILLLIAIGVIAFLIWRSRKYNPDSADKFIKVLEGLIDAKLKELEEKLKREYKTDSDINNALSDLRIHEE